MHVKNNIQYQEIAEIVFNYKLLLNLMEKLI